MADKVVPLRGDAPPPGEPVPDVVKELRETLAKAEAGEVRALAFVYVLANGRIQTGWCQPESGGDYASTLEQHGLGAGILTLSQRYAGRLWGDD